MRSATITLKSGEVLCAPIWEWRPEAGWLSLVGDVLSIVRLIDIDEAHVMQQQHIYQPLAGVRVDLLERARREGWDGMS
jgi:hypothetical protein